MTGHCGVVLYDKPTIRDEGRCSFSRCFWPFGPHIWPHNGDDVILRKPYSSEKALKPSEEYCGPLSEMT